MTNRLINFYQKCIPVVMTVNLIYSIGTIAMNGWSASSVVGLIVAVIWLELFCNSDSYFYIKG